MTISLYTVVAARIGGTVASETAGDAPIRLGMPSGILTVGGNVGQDGGA